MRAIIIDDERLARAELKKLGESKTIEDLMGNPEPREPLEDR